MAEAVAFIHSWGVVHCDIHPSNFFLDADGDLRLCDFEGSRYEGSDGGSLELTRFCPPRDDDEDAPRRSERSNVFALGSTMFLVAVGGCPLYRDVSSWQVEEKFRQEMFPDAEGSPGGEVIQGCWTGELESAEDVIAAIDDDRSWITW
jgi:serine/threonine protein kinase